MGSHIGNGHFFPPISSAREDERVGHLAHPWRYDRFFATGPATPLPGSARGFRFAENCRFRPFLPRSRRRFLSRSFPPSRRAQRYLARPIPISGDQLPRPWANTHGFRPETGPNLPRRRYLWVPTSEMVISSHQSLRLEKTSASVTSPTPGGMIDFSLRAPQRRCPGAHTASDLPKIADSGRFFHDLAVAFCHARSPHRDERNGTWLAQFRFRATNFPGRGLTPTVFVPKLDRICRDADIFGFPHRKWSFLPTNLFGSRRRARRSPRPPLEV